jgi:hypothetical protein
VNIHTALTDRNLLGAGLGDGSTFATWLAVLRAAHGLPLVGADKARFDAVSGGREAPQAPVSELWCVVGRRAGKSRVAAGLAVYCATLVPHRLARGETGVVLVLSATRAQAKTVLNYCLGYLLAAPLLRGEIDSVTAETIRLKSGVEISVHTASFRSVRGRTILTCVFDEVAFWRDDTSSNPDKEIFRAVTPALAHSRGMLVAISSPYRRLGLLWERHREHFGQNTPEVLVVQGASIAFNPTLSQKMIDRAMRDDPEAAEAEWHGQFRSDIAAFLDDELITAAVRAGPRELPPRPGISYVAFIDASGGRSDCYTLCVGHREGDKFIADMVTGVAPKFDPAHVTASFAELLREYAVRKVVGDAYGGEWVSGAWRSQGFVYEKSDLPASALYQEAVPLFTRGHIEIPDHPALIRELRLLERRTSRIGKDAITHPRSGHDDYANSLAGCARIAIAKSRKLLVTTLVGIDGTYDGTSWPCFAERPASTSPDAKRAAQAAELCARYVGRA